MIVPNFRDAPPVARHHSSLAKPPQSTRRLVCYRGPIIILAHPGRVRLAPVGAIASLERAGSPVLESPFIDIQGLDPSLEGRWWNSKLCRRSKRSGNPAVGLGQRRLDNLLLASRLNIQSG